MYIVHYNYVNMFMLLGSEFWLNIIVKVNEQDPIECKEHHSLFETVPNSNTTVYSILYLY